MISWHDLYTVLSAVVPLYVAMALAYGSVRWWGVITPDQCGGINRFVAVFAVPLLSFKVISGTDLYAMDLRFAAADTLHKCAVLAALAASARFFPGSGGSRLDWPVTLFSFATLPNTLIMGIPLLVAMYGSHAGDLMVQLVVLQCIVWYTLLLFLFELRAARALISAAAAAAGAGGRRERVESFVVDPDVVSLDGSHAEAQAEVAPDGSMRLTVRRASASASASRRSLMAGGVGAATPRASNLTGVEIYSACSSPRVSLGAHADLTAHPAAPASASASALRASSFGAADLFSLHSSRQHTPRPSASASFDERNPRATAAVAPVNDDDGAGDDDRKNSDARVLDWSSGASEVIGLPVFRAGVGRDSGRLQLQPIGSGSSRSTYVSDLAHHVTHALSLTDDESFLFVCSDPGGEGTGTDVCQAGGRSA